MQTFASKTVFITGASGGIGRACVEAFAAVGANVAMSDLGDAPSWSRELDASRIAFFPADLRDPSAIEHAISAAVKRFGSLDVLVNNAAAFLPLTTAHETSLDEFQLLFDINVRAVFLCCKHAYPHLERAKGNIVNVSSMAGVAGESMHAIYAATKGAVNSLTLAMAIDYGPRGVRCNAVCPSSVLTPTVDKMIAQSPDAAKIVEFRKRINHLRYTAQPSEIASVVLFLASPAASFMTGAIIPVSGGSEIGYGVKP